MTGPLTDTTNLSFTSGGITSRYHLYAAGLDWSRPVGLLVYTDGSGEYGLKNPSSTYLLGGTNGLVAVAKRQNMVLLTPLAPGTGCPDGDGTCWYQTSSGYTSTQKAAWSKALVSYIYTQYAVDSSRVALGGYSSGAQWLTEFFAPAHGVDVMTDGVGVAISYGGRPISSPTFTAAFKAAVPFVWDVGDRDSSYTTTSQYGVKAGEAWYRNNGFTTELNVVAGLGHARDGQFGAVMEREIIQHITGGGTPPPVANWQTTVQPTRTGAVFTINVPTTYAGRTYVRLQPTGNYLYTTETGPTAGVEFVSQPCGTDLTYRVEAPSGILKQSGSFRTLAC